MNKDTTKIAWYVAFYGLAGIVIGFISTSTAILLPAHNIIQHPDYWWEFLAPGIFGYTTNMTSYVIINCSFWLNSDRVKKLRNWMILFCILTVIIVVSLIIIYYLWTYGLKQNYPMPFQGSLLAYESIAILYILLWFCFPANWRSDNSFRHRLKFLYLALMFLSLIHISEPTRPY